MVVQRKHQFGGNQKSWKRFRNANKKTYKNHLKSSVEEKLKYAIDNNDAKIETKKIGQRKGTQKVITIDGKSYQYNPKKTISKVLTTKLTQLTKTKQFGPLGRDIVRKKATICALNLLKKALS